MAWTGKKWCPSCKKQVLPGRRYCDCGYQFSHMPTAREIVKLLEDGKHIVLSYILTVPNSDIGSYGSQSDHRAYITPDQPIRMSSFRSLFRTGKIEKKETRNEKGRIFEFYFLKKGDK